MNSQETRFSLTNRIIRFCLENKLVVFLVMVFVIGIQASFFFKYMDGSVKDLVDHVGTYVMSVSGQ